MGNQEQNRRRNKGSYVQSLKKSIAVKTDAISTLTTSLKDAERNSYILAVCLAISLIGAFILGCCLSDISGERKTLKKRLVAHEEYRDDVQGTKIKVIIRTEDRIYQEARVRGFGEWVATGSHENRFVWSTNLVSR